MHPVEVRLTESVNKTVHGHPVMRHARLFTDALSDEVLFLVLALRFCGAGGLMVDSTAESEEVLANGCGRLIRGFRPLGSRLGSTLAGCFHVQQELIECTPGPKGSAAIIKMTFSPSKEKDSEPSGSFLWLIEPADSAREQGALWTELINSPETVSRQLPTLRISRAKRLVFRFGHDRLIAKAAQRIAEILNTRGSSDIQFNMCAAEQGLRFGLAKRALENGPIESVNMD